MTHKHVFQYIDHLFIDKKTLSMLYFCECGKWRSISATPPDKDTIIRGKK